MPWRTIGKMAGYVAFFVFSTVFFMYVTFPMDKVAAFISYQLEHRLGVPIEIGTLEVNGLSGFEMWDVSLQLPAASAAEETAGDAGNPAQGSSAGVDADDHSPPAEERENPKALAIDRVKVETGLLDLASGTLPEAWIEADLLGGEIRDLHIDPSDGLLRIKAPSVKGIRLGDSLDVKPFFPFGLDLRGEVDLQVDLTWGGTLATSEGTLELEVHDAVVKKPSFRFQGADYVLTDLALGTLRTKLVVATKKDIPDLRAVPGPRDATVLHVETAEVDGRDVELIADTRSAIILKKNAPLGHGSLHARLAFQLTDEMFDKEEVTDGQREKPNSFLRTIIKNSKKFKRSEKNGFYGLSCTGRLSKPDCNLSRPTMRVGFARPSGVEPISSEKGGASDDKDRGAGATRDGAAAKNKKKKKKKKPRKPKRKKNKRGDDGSARKKDPKADRDSRLERIRKARERAAARKAGPPEEPAEELQEEELEADEPEDEEAEDEELEIDDEELESDELDEEEIDEEEEEEEEEEDEEEEE